MRVTMIHAIAESIPPVRLAFDEEFPEAEVINVLDESLLVDFDDQLTPDLRRRITNIIGYCQDNKADAIGLACSVYAPVVESAKDLVHVPLVSSYGPVMADAVTAGPRIGLIASVAATMQDSKYYLHLAADEAGVEIEPQFCLAEDLITVMRAEGQSGLERRLEEEVLKIASKVDVVLLTQFSFAAALAHLEKVSPIPVLSAPHSSARTLKKLLS